MYSLVYVLAKCARLRTLPFLNQGANKNTREIKEFPNNLQGLQLK
jgi:hypothetical protein